MDHYMSDQKGTILLVEDNPNLRKLYSDILGFNGYEVLTAEDGELGWEMAKANKPDFILLDLEMPKLDGFGVLKLIRADVTTKSIPVVVFSAVNMKADVEKAIGLGANGYMNKGVHSPRYVLDTIKSFMPKLAPDHKKTLDPSPKPGLHKLQVTEYQQGSDGQWTEGISVKGYRCPRCEEEMIMEMYPGPEQDGGHWYYSRLVCVKCLRFF
jgi:CheY-like chemotaxis protein